MHTATIQQQQQNLSPYFQGRKIHTDRGKSVSEFTMRCFFYKPWVDETTGEVLQAKFTYRGDLLHRKYAYRNIRFNSQLDVLLYHANLIQSKCEVIEIYDNNLPGNDALLIHVIKGEVVRPKPVADRIAIWRSYNISIQKIKFVKHVQG